MDENLELFLFDVANKWHQVKERCGGRGEEGGG